PVVIFLNHLKSSGKCHGIALPMPITRLSDMAAMALKGLTRAILFRPALSVNAGPTDYQVHDTKKLPRSPPKCILLTNEFDSRPKLGAGAHRMKKKLVGRYIVTDPRICHGQPTFRGTRILVADVLEQVPGGLAWQAIVGDWRGSIGEG